MTAPAGLGPRTGEEAGVGAPAGARASTAPAGLGPRTGEGASGEHLGVPERVILAPALGVFRPVDEKSPEGRPVETGEVVGVVEVNGRSVPVRSAFTGLLVGMMAHPGERVREGQPVAWLRVH